jgi:pilus assembly protein CpaF
MVDARLKDGSRVNVIIPPLALRGPTITIRKFSKTLLTLDKLVEFGALSEAMKRFLIRCVRVRKNIVVSGGTGSGKTTLLNALSQHIDGGERIVTIEDSAELQLQQPHVVRLETRPPNFEGHGMITIRDLVKNALRMRPDRIVVGECRGGEALDMLQAMNTGHDGSLTTLHANNPTEAVNRLETLCLMADVELPLRAIRTQIAGAVDVIIQQSRLGDGSRKVTAIAEVTGINDNEEVNITPLYVFQRLPRAPGSGLSAKIAGRFRATGYVPSFIGEFYTLGLLSEDEEI